jgi:hypothetical protein
MATTIDVDYELHVLEQDDWTPPCESGNTFCTDRGTHPAAWYATSPCVAVIAVCDPRRVKCRQDGGWDCMPNVAMGGCRARHEYHLIGWERING